MGPPSNTYRDTLLHDAGYLLVDRFYQPERELLHEMVARFDRRYREHKRQAGLIDFSDLEEYAVRLLEESEAARTGLVAQFDHVLMDEFHEPQPTRGSRLQEFAGLCRGTRRRWED